MGSYKTPGVYIEEIPKLPQSVADVPTAIPGFVGYTEFASSGSDKTNKDLSHTPVRIGSLLEYEKYFGKAKPMSVSGEKGKHRFVLYDSIRLFYDNGGGVCYIVSIGGYDFDKKEKITPENFKAGLQKLENIDEVTLLVMPDAATCLEAKELASVQQAALLQCKTLKDRFAILDVKELEGENPDKFINNSITTFRDSIGTEGLEYGAAYYPYISTSYTYTFDFSFIVKLIMEEKYKKDDKGNYNTEQVFELFNNHIPSCLAFLRAWNPERMQAYVADKTDEQLKSCYSPDNISYELVRKIWDSTKCKEEYGIDLDKEKKNKLYEEKYNNLKNNEELKAYIITQLIYPETFDSIDKDDVKKKQKADLFIKKKVIEDLVGSAINNKDFNFMYLSKYILKINDIDKDQHNKEQALKTFIPFYEGYEKGLADQASIVPPSGAIAGIYAQNDNFSGVWKAPANMSLASVRGINRLINNRLQEDMNIHTTGKSINAIRAFSGKGILVWGARTLKGNDNEWRYIPVRRLFNYVEESVQKSTEWAVFSPNNQNTWTKIKSQIENFLTNIWRAGGLAGATPGQAFFVNVGLNITMDTQDILEGRLIVEVGMAAVRPAEFIIIRFSHKLQES